MEELRFNPDFLAYLAHALIYCTTEQDSHRAVAGLLIKNTLTSPSASTMTEKPEAMAYVKNTILEGLADGIPMIRQTVGAVIAGILSLEEPGGWPQALEVLTKGMSSQDNNMAEVR